MKATEFDTYVHFRLDCWGREFRLDRDCEILGHAGKNMLAVLLEHKGEMPAKPTGYKPLTIPHNEMQIEDIVRDIHLDVPILAAVLRAAYCGWGRQGVERLEIAERLSRRSLTRRQYYVYRDMGFQRVAGALAALARAA